MMANRIVLCFFLCCAAVATSAQKEEIIIGEEDVASMIEEREELLMRPLDKSEKDELVRDALYDEILVREAIKLNLHLSDKAVRERLVSIMAFTYEPKSEKPTEEELKTYFQENRTDFDLPPKYTFEHIYLEPGNSLKLDEVMHADDWKSLGNEHWAGRVIQDKPTYEIVLFLGESVAESIKVAPLNKWEGPIPSPIGNHFIRLVEKTKPQPLSFEVSRERVEKVWIERNKAEKFHSRMMLISNKYNLILPQEYRSILN